ncbi:translation initiation factor 2 [Cereibacter sphaeroides]|uniref:translation initiation factor 2 n=1 Tax=Cereibacter sphaeroides TaxID=1063 RepID=UPI000F52C15F|nr:translation initiation factor 2 [Cereibacter sphaeroides]AZB60033.1 translation initiation factor 2 [Cereibacter sphaeroides]
MKPRFALNLTPEAASLLRRMPDGWDELGSVPFDADDTEAALAALRAEAEALAGDEGVTTKVVIPRSQILYMTLAAPGPDKTSRRAQIREGLEGLTPYEVKDLVYDFEPEGADVRLAVVARETLDEAENFAEQHGFNPVAFVALPEAGDFPREPAFGIISAAQRRLPKGVKVERDLEPIRILAAPVAVADLPDEVEAPLAEEPPLEAALSDEVSQEDAAREALAEAEAEPMLAEPEPAEALPTEPEPDEEPRFAPERADPVEPEPSPVTEPEPVQTLTEPVGEEAGSEEEEAWQPAPDPAVLASLTPDEAALPLPGPEEETEEPEEPREEFLVPPPLVRAVERPIPHARELPPFAPEPEPEPAPAARADIPEAPYVELADDDVPDMPPGAFASRRVEAKARLAAEEKPVRPPAQVAEQGVRVRVARSAMPPQGPAQPNGRLKAQPLPNGSALPGAPPKAAARSPKLEAPARKDVPFSGLGGRPTPSRGKPRFLGLILTLVLLLVLAAVAAVSSYFVASGDSQAETALAVAERLPDAAPADEEETAAVEPEAAAEAPAEVEAETPDEPARTAAAPAPDVPEAASSATAPASEAPQVASGATDPALPADTPQDEIFLTTMDTPPPSLDAVAAPPPEIALDAAPGLPLPPPPFGASYELDENGLIRPSAEGVLAPGEFLLIAGKPPILPPRRPAAEEPEEAAADPAPAAPGSIFPGSASAEAPAADPALQGHRPKVRPDRPEDSAAAAAEAAPEPEADTRMSGLRPRARPSDASPEEPPAQAATIAMATSPAPRPDGAPEAIATSNGAISPLAIAVSRKPEARPSDFSNAIEAAVAAAVQEPRTPVVVAAVAPPKQVAPAVRAPSPEEEDEPEVSVAPRIPTRANVAQNATFANAINLSKTNLIGVYGSSSNRYALVRQSNGRYVKVRVGDRIDGGVVAAITASELRYQKGSRIFALSMPKG